MSARPAKQRDEKSDRRTKALQEFGLDPAALPRHIAIIMDGNGRWAKKRGLPRVKGHRAAVKTVRDIVEFSAEIGTEYLTLYAFSVENWRRPKSEVQALMRLLRQYLVTERARLMENMIRLRTIGRMEELPGQVREELRKTIELTRDNRGLTVVLALNYGGRTEIVDAARTCVREALQGKLSPEQIDEEVFGRFLYTGEVPDPDLLIRTAGEYRVSNFLLWQISYCEIWTTPVLWPDFRRHHMAEALKEFATRERRYGGVR
jgi:undecaprenyl diphosphate synthase